uniref:Uncharacterized protein n=1 Tax=Lygus hesperus TaxID=30085 RepID=A0A146KX43_LYGHE
MHQVVSIERFILASDGVPCDARDSKTSVEGRHTDINIVLEQRYGVKTAILPNQLDPRTRTNNRHIDTASDRKIFETSICGRQPTRGDSSTSSRNSNCAQESDSRQTMVANSCAIDNRSRTHGTTVRIVAHVPVPHQRLTSTAEGDSAPLPAVEHTQRRPGTHSAGPRCESEYAEGGQTATRVRAVPPGHGAPPHCMCVSGSCTWVAGPQGCVGVHSANRCRDTAVDAAHQQRHNLRHPPTAVAVRTKVPAYPPHTHPHTRTVHRCHQHLHLEYCHPHTAPGRFRDLARPSPLLPPHGDG